MSKRRAKRIGPGVIRASQVRIPFLGNELRIEGNLIFLVCRFRRSSRHVAFSQHESRPGGRIRPITSCVAGRYVHVAEKHHVLFFGNMDLTPFPARDCGQSPRIFLAKMLKKNNAEGRKGSVGPKSNDNFAETQAFLSQGVRAVREKEFAPRRGSGTPVA